MKNILMCLFVLSTCYSQKSSEIVNIIPMTPESYQFKKNLVNDVSYYTGQPNISVPIYTINFEGLEIPISISCNTTGIKVQEESSIVGLGWMLNIGGEISRSNHGAADEKSFISTPYQSQSGIGYLKNEIVKSYPLGANPYPAGTPQATEYGMREGLYLDAINHSNPYLAYQYSKDLRPDEFFYSLFGHSGKFMYSQALSKFVTFPLDNIVINHLIEYEQGSSYVFKDFTVTLPNGYKVILGSDGRRGVRKISGPIFYQAWQTKKIISPKNREVVYNYTLNEYNSCTPNSWSAISFDPVFEGNISGTPPPVEYVTGNCYEYQNKEGLISSIVFPAGTIEFIYADRLDLYGGSKRLIEVKVYDKNEVCIKKVKFNQTYFSNLPNSPVVEDYLGKRLRLDSVEIFGNDDLNPQKYSFDYYTFDKIPSKRSYATDHWGYFTGRDGQSLIPPNLDPNCLICNKDVDENYCKTFTLKKIQYPEGGVKIFEYESNKTDVSTSSNVTMLYEALSNDLFTTHWFGASISGYALNNYTPVPTQGTNSYTRYIYGEPFDILLNDDFFPSNINNLTLSSTLPSKVPWATFNNHVEFTLEKFNGSSYVQYAYLGKISNTENTSGIINQRRTLPIGKYRFKINLAQNYNLTPEMLYMNHGSNIGFKIRRRSQSEFNIGGLRIKEIHSYENSALIGKKYLTRFSYLNDNGKSSGVVTSIPAYTEDIAMRQTKMSNGESLEMRFRGKRNSSQSVLPMLKTSGSIIGYTKVTKEEVGSSGSIKQDFYYTFQNPFFSDMWQNDVQREFEPKDWQRGKLMKINNYKENDLVSEELFEYYGQDYEYDKGYVEEINTDLMDKTELVYDDGTISKYVNLTSNEWLSKYGLDNITLTFTNNTQKIPYFKIYTGFEKLKSKTLKEHFQGNILETKEEYFYDGLPNNLGMSSKASHNSINELLETRFYYPGDSEVSTEPYVSELIAKNIVEIPLRTEVVKNGNKISNRVLKYNNWGSLLLLPKIIQVSKGENLLENSALYNNYDSVGNPLEVQQESGMKVSYIWGYNKTLLIAKIENASNAEIATALGLSNLSNINETNLATINTLRNLLPNSLVTTYTYNPLIGVTSVTDPKGYKTTYEYDTFGRLFYIRDHDGKILSETQYKYRPQN